MIEINGEQVTVDEARALLRMLYNDARQIAGEFHNMNRSAKFRVNWPDEQKFASANWKSFVQPVRQLYAQKLGDPRTSEADKKRIHQVLVLEHKIAEGAERDNRLQLAPGSQQFEGDKAENKAVVEKFGARPNLRAALLNSIATRH